MHVAEVAAEVAAESETGSPLEIEARAHLPGAIARILGRLHAGESAELRTGDIGIGREEIGVVGQVGEGALQPQADFVRQRKRLGKAGGDGDRSRTDQGADTFVSEAPSARRYQSERGLVEVPIVSGIFKIAVSDSIRSYQKRARRQIGIRLVEAAGNRRGEKRSALQE